MFSRSGSIVLLLCPSFITLTFIITAIRHLFELGKSKTCVKKVSRSIPIFEKLSLKGYIDRCEYHQTVAIRIRGFYLVYLFVLIVGLVFFLLSTLVTDIVQVANCFGIVKFLTMDIPFGLFSFFKTKHDLKHGGVTWKWDVE